MGQEDLFATVALDVEFLEDACLGRLRNRLPVKVRRFRILRALVLPKFALIIIILVPNQLPAVHTAHWNDHFGLLTGAKNPEMPFIFWHTAPLGRRVRLLRLRT